MEQDSTIQPLQIPPPSLQHIGGSVDSSARSANAPIPTRTGPAATTTTLQTRYRQRPAQHTSSAPAPRTGKRKHAMPRSIRYFEGTSSDDDEGNEYGGDGTSSSESTPLHDHVQAKRPRISRTSRSSTRSPFLDVGMQGTSTLSSPAPDHEGTSSLGITAINTSISLADPHPSNSPVESTDERRAHHEVPEASLDKVDGASHEAEATSATVAEIIPAEPELTARPAPIVDAPIAATVTAPAVPPRVIDTENVPAFLLSHSKGSRQVNIFKYLNELQEPRFQQVLFRYVHFETRDKSNTNGSLPTTGRPPEISKWTSRARPAYLPECAKGEQTTRTFVDSILGWWGSIQPEWRLFERGVVSHKVQGDWGGLHAPGINGLLNVVILVYWWGRILEECRPEDGVRADYEFFAEDVAWVLSQLDT